MGYSVFQLLDLGIQAYRAGNFTRAIDELSELIKSQPDNWEGRLYLAMSFYKLGNVSQATSHFATIKDNCPDVAMRSRAELAYKNVTIELKKVQPGQSPAKQPPAKQPPAKQPEPVAVTLKEAGEMELVKAADEYYDKK